MLDALRQRPWRRALVWLALLAPLFYISYGWANYRASVAAQQGLVHQLAFEWEAHIPFWQWTIFPYWTINVFYGLSLLLATSRHVLDRHALRLVTAQLVAVTCFVLWPLRFGFAQPAADGLAGMLFAALRSFDQPYNQAPSLHIALAVILWDFYRRIIHGTLARGVLHVWTLLICGSVLTTFQHHFIDIPTGALLGVLVLLLWPLERRVSLFAALRRRPPNLRLAGYYALGAALFAGVAVYGGGWALWLLWVAAALLWVCLCYLVLGPRGLHMNRRGRMAWPARWLLAPYRAGAWLNARLWTRNLPLANEVVPGLWLGRLPGAAEWQRAGQPVVVSMCAELQNPDTLHGYCLPLLDMTFHTQADLRRAARVIRAHREAGRTVWVCCALGFYRSATLMLHSLVALQHAPTPQEARTLIQRARPQVRLA